MTLLMWNKFEWLDDKTWPEDGEYLVAMIGGDWSKALWSRGHWYIDDGDSRGVAYYADVQVPNDALRG